MRMIILMMMVRDVMVMMVLIMLMINFLLVTYYSEKCTDHILGGWEPPAARG